MAVGRKTSRRGKAISRRNASSSRSSRSIVAAKRAHTKRPRTHVGRRSGGPKISRARLRVLRDDLDRLRNTMTETWDNVWVVSEHDIRETLGRTQQKIGNAVDLLKTAA